MSEYQPFNNPYPRLYGESVERRESFDRIAAKLKKKYAEQDNPISDDEAVEAARNLIGYVELAMKIAERNLRVGKIPQEEIAAAKKRAEEMGLLTDDGQKSKRKKRKLKHPEPQS